LAENPYIAFKKVSISFDGEVVLRDFSFEAPAGKHTVLKGESGSGKSTILKLLLGFLKPDQGSVMFKKRDVHPQRIRQRTAWLPQDLNLGDGLVHEVMQQPFSFKINSSLDKVDFSGTLEALGVPKANLNKPFRDLSTGQRQRVGLAICHLLDKPLLLLDEPTSALDQVTKQKVADVLLEGKRTIISTSHDPFWVELADKVIQLD